MQETIGEGGQGMKDVDLEGGHADHDSNAHVDYAASSQDAKATYSRTESPVSSSADEEHAQAAVPGANNGGREDESDEEAGRTMSSSRAAPPDSMLPGTMDGIGEDQKPYNYICNLDKVNFGGPGWFNDVFKVSIEVDADRTWMDTLSLSLVPRTAFQRHCKLLDAAKPITGKVTVEAPPGKQVWLTGVIVKFEEHVVMIESDLGELVGALEAKVATGQFVTGKVTFPFKLDLQLLDTHRMWPVRESYVGDILAMRHAIKVTAERPWYTFNVVTQIPIAMQVLSRLPRSDAGQPNEEGGPNHIVVISDCNGRCEFDFGIDSYPLDGVIEGTMRFSGVTMPIASAHIMLLKAEFLYGEAAETLIAEHTVLGNKRRRKDENAVVPKTREEQIRLQNTSPFIERKHVHFVDSHEHDCRRDPVLGDAKIDVRLPLGSLPLTPSHMSLTQDIACIDDMAELVGVRYYVRLVLEDNNGAAFWNTHEVFFHRGALSPSSTDMSNGLAVDNEDTHFETDTEEKIEMNGGRSDGNSRDSSTERQPDGAKAHQERSKTNGVTTDHPQMAIGL